MKMTASIAGDHHASRPTIMLFDDAAITTAERKNTTNRDLA
jgi:hypothetical protein